MSRRNVGKGITSVTNVIRKHNDNIVSLRDANEKLESDLVTLFATALLFCQV
jgi:hypothetical protein